MWVVYATGFRSLAEQSCKMIYGVCWLVVEERESGSEPLRSALPAKEGGSTPQAL